MSDLKLGDRVKFTGTVRKSKMHWGTVRYEDAPLPAFLGHNWAKDNKTVVHSVSEGVVVGKRRYTSMDHDEGIWIPDGVQIFTAYLIAWNLSRSPVIVRLDQIAPPTTEAEGVTP